MYAPRSTDYENQYPPPCTPARRGSREPAAPLPGGTEEGPPAPPAGVPGTPGPSGERPGLPGAAPPPGEGVENPSIGIADSRWGGRRFGPSQFLTLDGRESNCPIFWTASKKIRQLIFFSSFLGAKSCPQKMRELIFFWAQKVLLKR